MSKTAQKTDPKLWEKVKSKVTRSGKGGEPGQWSARKAQLAVQEYKKLGGGYLGEKSDDNSLKQWSDEDWGTKSGRNSRETGKRDLPKKARKALAGDEDRKTSAKKGADTKKGKRRLPASRRKSKRSRHGTGNGQGQAAQAKEG